MNSDETTRVLNRLKAAFDKRLSEDAYRVWCENLAELAFSPAYATARQIEREAKYFPAISEFLAAYTTHERDQRPYTPPTACRHCDNGFRLIDDTNNVVVPCALCRPELYEAWANGKVPKTKEPPNAPLFTARTAAEVAEQRKPLPPWVLEARERIGRTPRAPVAAPVITEDDNG